MTKRKDPADKIVSLKDEVGKRYTRLVVQSRAPSDSNGNARWNCICDCGNTTVSHGFSLRNGASKSCGCLTTEQLKDRATTHNMSSLPEWRVWVDMRMRCSNPNAGSRWHRYGGRGIKVCDRWVESFVNFYDDMGPRPSSKHSIERKNKDGDYEPDNCEWATIATQNRNKCNNHYVEYKGKSMTLTDAVALAGAGISIAAVNGRLRRGWPMNEAVETPPNPRVYVPSWGRHRGH